MCGNSFEHFWRSAGRRGRDRAAALVLLAGLLLLPPVLEARVVEVRITSRESVLGGRAFGEAGPYEKITGRIFFAFDPEAAENARIVDLHRAPVNSDGMVEAWADFMVLQPRNPGLRSGTGWIEVVNRGGKASLAYLQGGTFSSDPETEEDFGDGLLMERGVTLLWIGWQWDVPEGEDLMRLAITVAREDGGTITGLVRSDWVVEEETSRLSLGHRDHRPYLPVAADHPDHVLTVRDGREAPPEEIPREQWRLVDAPSGPDAGRPVLVELDGAFQPGRIYELVYRARDPRVVGLGLLAVRDVVSYAKYDLRSVFPLERGIAFGVSQTGRFLRHLLYEGLNVDEEGRTAFDGMLVHTAGAGRGSFNHRFAQPSRDAHRFSAFFYPTDVFPFTGRSQRDPVPGREEGLLDRLAGEHRPRVMLTNTGYEYWGRAASLVHTGVEGREDVEPLEGVRIYHLASGQHFVGGFPPEEGALMEGTPALRGNPLDFLVTLRALTVRLVEWVEGDVEPPPTTIPRIGAGTLVPVEGVAFPRIPEVEAPDVAHVAYRVDYGPRFLEHGIVDRQPPELGPAFPVLVPQVDGIGNELGGLRGVEVRVPVATYAPWNLRIGLPGPEDELTDFRGTFIPLPRTESERDSSGDPRPSLEALYGDREGYESRVEAAIDELIAERILLSRDADRVRRRAADLWEWAESREPPGSAPEEEER